MKILLPVASDKELSAGVDVAHPHNPPKRSVGASLSARFPNIAVSIAGIKIDMNPAITTYIF